MNSRSFDNLMAEWKIAVVHFSFNAVMDNRFTFPSDLHHAIDTFEHEPRSCCALYPGHNMNLPGSVGVIFCPSYSHVLSVYSADSGSSNYAGVEGSLGHDPDEESVLESLDVPDGEYNEWRLMGATPSGIFVADPHCIWVKRESTIELGSERITDIGPVQISLQDVRAAFPCLNLFTMGAEGLELV